VIRRLAAVAAVLTLAGCFSPSFSPNAVHVEGYLPRPDGGFGAYRVEANRGPGDGLGSMFRVAVVCSGSPGVWRRSEWINVENAANMLGGWLGPGAHWTASAWCPSGQRAVAQNVERGHS
jgi:hypothetical protein